MDDRINDGSNLVFLSASYALLTGDAAHDHKRAANQPKDAMYAVEPRDPDQLLKFDRYKQLRQVSLMFTDYKTPVAIKHYLLGDAEPNQAWASRYKDIVPTTLSAYASESGLVQDVWRAIREREPAPEYVAGWKISTTIFPLLVSKGIQHGAGIPERFLTDPVKNYRTQNIYAIENIYTQGVYSHARFTPELQELMEWWGIQSNDGWPMLDRQTLARLTTREWLDYGLQNVEKYLLGMADIVALYGGSACSAKRVVATSLRGPGKPDHETGQ